MDNLTLIDYCGRIKYETINELISQFKLQATKLVIPIAIYKRLLQIMIETLENIMKHCEFPKSDNDKNYLPSLRITKEKNIYTVRSSNPLNNKAIPLLKKKIDYINSLDAQSLKNIYKETITNGVFTKSGGAGLGFIEIARISGKRIIYEFNPIDKLYSMYVQLVTIDEK